MRVRCPHCQNPVEVLDDSSLCDILCESCGSDFSLVVDETRSFGQLEQPTLLGQFELLEQLGTGAFGTVWRARDTKLDREVAVKIPRKEQLTSGDIEKFLREARAAAQLRHPNIVGVHEVGRVGETVYIVSDYIQGVTLADWLTGHRPSISETLQLVIPIAEALHVAHERGIVHRDLKPSNVLLDLAETPFLTDFGLAKRHANEITMTAEGQILGTPAYMAPEQASGDGHAADRRADIYSLGVLLFELSTGERPFRGNTRMLIHQVLHEDAPSPRKLNQAVPKDLETVILRCLEKQPEKRLGTAKELAEELDRIANNKPIQSRPTGSLERSVRWCLRNKAVATLLFLIGLTLITATLTSTTFWFNAAEQRDVAMQRNEQFQRLGEIQNSIADEFLRLSELAKNDEFWNEFVKLPELTPEQLARLKVDPGPVYFELLDSVMEGRIASSLNSLDQLSREVADPRLKSLVDKQSKLFLNLFYDFASAILGRSIEEKMRRTAEQL